MHFQILIFLDKLTINFQAKQYLQHAHSQQSELFQISPKII
jgi:hypothetical protein